MKHASVSLQDIHKNIMSYEEYNRKKFSVPYFFEIEKGTQLLYYFGVHHSYNPSDSQFLKLVKHWGEFKRQTESSKSLILVEGGARQFINDPNEAILKGGEATLITHLAHKSFYNTFSPEPTRAEETNHLLSKYSKEEIQYYYFARVVHQWGTMVEKPNFESYIERFLERDKKEFGWKDFDFSLNSMKNIHQKLFNNKFDEQQEDFFYKIVNPTSRSTIINAVSQDLGKERDVLIVKNILEKWNEGKSLFIVYGSTHAVVQEPALRKFIKEKATFD